MVMQRLKLYSCMGQNVSVLQKTIAKQNPSQETCYK